MRRERALREVPELRRAAALGLRGPDANGNWFVCCPFCEGRAPRRRDEEYKLTIRISGELPAREPDRPEPVPLTPERGVWNCYRCAARGFADFRWLLEGVQVIEGNAPAPVEPPNLGPPDGFVPVAECERSISMRWVPEYFKARGVLDAARRVGAGGCHRARYQGRVVVPFLEEPRGPWLGFSARLVDGRGDGPKYLYPRGMGRRDALWGVAWLEGTSAVWIVEGVFDALPLFPRAVATLGKAVTGEQLDRLVALGRPLVACLDGDAWEDCRALATRLSMRGAAARWAHLPPATDPGQLGWAVVDHVVA